MDVCGLPNARPIICNDCPAFQRHHTSVLCAAESPARFPWAIDTTSEEKIYIRWCCIDLLSSPNLSGITAYSICCKARFGAQLISSTRSCRTPNDDYRTSGVFHPLAPSPIAFLWPVLYFAPTNPRIPDSRTAQMRD